jgi:protein-serine/threonine kinase
MKHVREVLDAMGVEITVESEYKLRCVRPKRKKGVVGVQATQIGIGNGQSEKDGASGVAALTMSGSAASSGVCICLQIYSEI